VTFLQGSLNWLVSWLLGLLVGWLGRYTYLSVSEKMHYTACWKLVKGMKCTLYVCWTELGYLSGIALVYGMNDQWFESGKRLGIFLFTTVSISILGPIRPPIQWLPGGLSLEVKRPVRESDHSPQSSAEVKNAWSYTATPHYAFMGPSRAQM
jgi:hypothetical protein